LSVPPKKQVRGSDFTLALDPAKKKKGEKSREGNSRGKGGVHGYRELTAFTDENC